ncbi:MAG: NADH-quinone oxidoreductase subunit G [Actinomycetaceae bacterium]|nr:NADH-quinone oxidoreductase subunit G [Actinomycetaceae bacterium]
MTTKEAVSLITVTIDGKEASVPAGTLIIRAAEQIGVRIPRFCDHPLLAPVAACRQCLVEVARPGRDGTVAKGPKPVPACAEAVAPGMEVYTQFTSEVARKAQRGIMEFLLINHPLDCPVCDKGGECPLQNQALEDGRENSRFADIKRTFPKPVQVSSQILLDRDRCILCQRCTRFQSQIAGDPFIALQGRGGGNPGFEVHSLNGSQIGDFDARVLNFADSDGGHGPVRQSQYVGSYGQPGIAEGFASGPVELGEMDESGRPFASYFSGNIIQICPVGALTSAAYRFRSRPFDLVSVPGVAEHDASGSAIRVDYRRGTVLRRLSGEDPDVNEEWITDKDRFAFRWQDGPDRLTTPLVRDASGELVPTSWGDALDVAARGLAGAGGVGVLTGGRLTMEDAYAYSKFARVVLGTNDIDFRTRPASLEEDAFLASTVAGTGLGVTYRDLETAGHVLAVGFEAEEECGTVFLRLRKGVLAGTTSVTVIAPYATAGTAKMNARLLQSVPGLEAATIDRMEAGDPSFDALTEHGIVLVGERAAESPGTLSAALRLAERTGARVAWIPRRAGDRGAVEAGAVGNLLPGGRPVAEPTARAQVAAAWGAEIPSAPGRPGEAILDAARRGELGGLLLGGVELSDLPGRAREAIEAAGFVVSLEVRSSEVTELADVVLPVAPPAEKGGSFVNWEGRIRPFGQALTSVQLPDRIVLNDLALEMGADLGLATLADAVAQIRGFAPWDGERPAAPREPANVVYEPQAGKAILATWNLMLGQGALQAHEPHLAGTARLPVALMSRQTAQAAGVGDGTEVTISGPEGSVSLPVVQVRMPDDVVWVPQNSLGCQVFKLGARSGDAVGIAATLPLTAEVAK